MNLPNADKLDIDIDAEGFLERHALLPTNGVRARVHLVRKWDLLVVVRGQEPDLVQHAGEGARGVCTTRESEQADLVPCLIYR